MKFKSKNKMSTETLALGAILTALVVVLQFMGSFIHLGMFSISLVLIPIVIGAATCGVGVGAWLGFVFGLVVLFSGGANLFLALDVLGTLVTVLVKGTACGFVAALVYRAVEKLNRYAAVVAAAIVCPIVNTGIFMLGCILFFMDDVPQLAEALGSSAAGLALFWGLAMANFLFELGMNIVLSPAIVRILNIRKKA